MTSRCFTLKQLLVKFHLLLNVGNSSRCLFLTTSKSSHFSVIPQMLITSLSSVLPSCNLLLRSLPREQVHTCLHQPHMLDDRWTQKQKPSMVKETTPCSRTRVAIAALSETGREVKAVFAGIIGLISTLFSVPISLANKEKSSHPPHPPAPASEQGPSITTNTNKETDLCSNRDFSSVTLGKSLRGLRILVNKMKGRRSRAVKFIELLPCTRHCVQGS